MSMPILFKNLPSDGAEINLHDISPTSESKQKSEVKSSQEKSKSSSKTEKPNNPLGLTTSSRYENSLLETTRKFMMLKQITRDKILNLNDAADFLEVPKRRLYDISNVLEGISFVEKIGKNAIRWRDEVPDHIKQKQLEQDVEVLEEQEKNIDAFVHDCKSLCKLVKENPVDIPYMYVSKSEISKFDEKNKTSTFVVRSSCKDIDIKIDDYSESGSHMFIRTKNKQQLEVLFCENPENSSKSTTKCSNDSSTQNNLNSVVFLSIEKPASPPMRPWNNLAQPPSLLDVYL
ncbi:unnamed protein product [Caenorhabditis angaria]|uniref:E2F/DP family winged-helix DNA-binding domain-containing protein n=1 Tax=Caenorhabditis angaria TaxID=860376 RepID=A0A9P1I4Q7_9PELO|nr:unnamed protein product [Caenorhabditis angaria]